METATALAKKQDVTQTSSTVPSSTGGSSNLLTRADTGLFVVGRVEMLGDVRHRSGKDKNGRDFSFYSQTASIAAKGKMYEINWMADTKPSNVLVVLELDEIVRIEVGNPREYKGKISFDAL